MQARQIVQRISQPRSTPLLAKLAGPLPKVRCQLLRHEGSHPPRTKKHKADTVSSAQGAFHSALSNPRMSHPEPHAIGKDTPQTRLNLRAFLEYRPRARKTAIELRHTKKENHLTEESLTHWWCQETPV